MSWISRSSVLKWLTWFHFISPIFRCFLYTFIFHLNLKTCRFFCIIKNMVIFSVLVYLTFDEETRNILGSSCHMMKWFTFSLIYWVTLPQSMHIWKQIFGIFHTKYINYIKGRLLWYHGVCGYTLMVYHMIYICLDMATINRVIVIIEWKLFT